MRKSEKNVKEKEQGNIKGRLKGWIYTTKMTKNEDKKVALEVL
jgi:hypothetical protein